MINLILLVDMIVLDLLFIGVPIGIKINLNLPMKNIDILDPLLKNSIPMDYIGMKMDYIPILMILRIKYLMLILLNNHSLNVVNSLLLLIILGLMNLTQLHSIENSI